MDIQLFIQSKGKISLIAMRSAYVYLRAAQLEKHFIVYDDVSRGLFMGANLSSSEVIAHNALVYESAVMSIPFPDGTRRWQFQFDSDGEISFILRVIRCLKNITAGRFSSSVENFVRECERHSSSIYDHRVLLPMRQTGTFTNYGEILETTPAIQSFRQSMERTKTNGSATPDTKASVIIATSPPKDEFEVCENGIRFLAEIRRGGMDVLFPQVKHDQVLCIIFTVFTLIKSTAHKELIDLVMAVKECGLIPNLENVSKTKVRGVIALLKLASIVETKGSCDKLPVILTLSSAIDSVETMREQHDEFLSTFGAAQPQLWQEEVHWEKLIWGSAFSRRVEKIKDMEIFLSKLLTLRVMHPIIAAAPPGAVNEIFVTREKALENDSLYRSLSFNFHLSEDERDFGRDKNIVKIVGKGNSPRSGETTKLTSIASQSVSPANTDVNSASTSLDEWSVGSPLAAMSMSLPKADYRTPLMAVPPLANTFAFDHNQPSNATPMSVGDFMFAAQSPEVSQSQSFPPKQRVFPGTIRTNFSCERLGSCPPERDTVEKSLMQDREFLPRRHSVDSPTGLFSESLFKSPPPGLRDMADDSWYTDIEHKSVFRSDKGDNDRFFLAPQQQQQQEQLQMMDFTRRSRALPNPPDMPQRNYLHHTERSQQQDDFLRSKRTPEFLFTSPTPIQQDRQQERLYSDSFQLLKKHYQETEEQITYNQLQQYKLMRDTRDTAVHRQSQSARSDHINYPTPSAPPFNSSNFSTFGDVSEVPHPYHTQPRNISPRPRSNYELGHSNNIGMHPTDNYSRMSQLAENKRQFEATDKNTRRQLPF